MISRLFAIQAFIAFIILASSFTSSVNAAGDARARGFLFFGLVVGLLLTSDLAQTESDTLPEICQLYPTSEECFAGFKEGGMFLFLGIVVRDAHCSLSN